MDYKQLKKYQYSELISLRKFLFLPSSSLYKTLKSLHKNAFESNERIIFYYTGPIPYDLLAHLQRVVWHVDISNYFIAICNIHPETKDQIEQVRIKYSKDSNPFELIELEIKDQTLYQTDNPPLLNPPDTMCMYPWNNMELKPNGTIRPCCVYTSPITDVSAIPVNLNDPGVFSMEKIYFSADLKKLRQQFRQGEKPAGCKKCWQEEEQGIRSDRQLYNWIRRDQLHNIDYETEDIYNLNSLDLKLGNLCNLSCRICNSTLSSSWAVETLDQVPDPVEKKQHHAYISLRQGEWPKKQLDFWSEFQKILSHLRYMQFAGGEPLMLPHHFSVLEKAVDLGYARQITLRYNTNGTQYPESVLDKWKKFEMVNLDSRVDDIGKRFEYQRNGSSWQQVLENCKKFNLQRRLNFKTQISTSVSILNVYYLPEICAWINSENFDSWWLNLLNSPKEFSITNMTPSAKKLVLEKLIAYDFGQYQNQVDVFLSIIQNSSTVDGKDFVNAIKPIDLIRNQNFSLDHSDIAHAMGYVL